MADQIELSEEMFCRYIGSDNWQRWQKVKEKMKIESEWDFVSWLLDIAEHGHRETIVLLKYNGVVRKQSIKEEELDEVGAGADCVKNARSVADINCEPVKREHDQYVEAEECDEIDFPEVDAKDCDWDGRSKIGATRVERRSVSEKSGVVRTAKLSGRLYPCEVCGEVFPRLRERMTHIKSVHDAPYNAITGLFPCSLCALTFRYKCRLQTHVRRTHMRERTIKCDQCDMQFFDDHMWRRHVERVHERRCRYQCPHCERCFVYPKARSEHVKANHCPGESYICDTCGKGFTTSDGIRRHVDTHKPAHERRVTCNKCGRPFTGKRSLFKHVWMVHRRMHESVKERRRQQGYPHVLNVHAATETAAQLKVLSKNPILTLTK